MAGVNDVEWFLQSYTIQLLGELSCAPCAPGFARGDHAGNDLVVGVSVELWDFSIQFQLVRVVC